MGVFFRKSVKFGPVRLNLSKSGIGTSFGVKGLRVGINAKGNSYVAGGAKGLYFRNNLNTSSSNNLSVTQSANNSTGKSLYYVSYFTLLIFSILFPILIIGSAPWTIYLVYSLINKSKIKRFKKDLASNIETYFNNKNYELINSNILQIPAVVKNVTERQTFILDLYPRIIFNILNDKIITKTEEEVLHNVLSLIPHEIIKEVNIVLVNEILKNSLSDKKVSSEEEDLINRCISLLNLNEIKSDIDRTINDYKQLEVIEKSDLKTISPTININDNSDFYYENECDFMKTSTYKGIKSIVHDYSGKLLVSENNLHFVTDGHKSIKISSIITIDLIDENIEIIINNRKTPFYLSVKNPMTLLGTIKKIMNK